MVRDEILTGLNNAVSRGESLGKAVQSLISAGYNVQEIQEGAKQVNMGVIGTIPANSQIPNQTQQAEENKQLPTTQKPLKKNKWLIVGLLGVVFLALIGLGIYLVLKV